MSKYLQSLIFNKDACLRKLAKTNLNELLVVNVNLLSLATRFLYFISFLTIPIIPGQVKLPFLEVWYL